jgi:hypothetical protein
MGNPFVDWYVTPYTKCAKNLKYFQLLFIYMQSVHDKENDKVLFFVLVFATNIRRNIFFCLSNFSFRTFFRRIVLFCLSNYIFRSNFLRKEFLVLRSTQHGVAAIQIKVTSCFAAFLFLFLFCCLFVFVPFLVSLLCLFFILFLF